MAWLSCGSGGGQEVPYLVKNVTVRNSGGNYTDSFYRAGDLIVAVGWGYTINSGVDLLDTVQVTSDAIHGYLFETTSSAVDIALPVNMQAIRVTRDKALNYEVIEMPNLSKTFDVKKNDLLFYPQYDGALSVTNASFIQYHQSQTIDVFRVENDGQVTATRPSGYPLANKIIRIY